MKKIRLNESESQISSNTISDFIDTYELALPDSYIEFMSVNNGGYPELNYFIDKEDNLYEIQCFYCIRLELGDVIQELDKLSNIVRVLENEKIEKTLPDKYYPFGYDSGGNMYCISMNERSLGQIFKCYFDGSPAKLICNSFEEFINGLTKNNI